MWATRFLKHLLVAEKTPGTEDIATTAWSGDRGLTTGGDGTLRCDRGYYPCTNPQ